MAAIHVDDVRHVRDVGNVRDVCKVRSAESESSEPESPSKSPPRKKRIAGSHGEPPDGRESKAESESKVTAEAEERHPGR